MIETINKLDRHVQAKLPNTIKCMQVLIPSYNVIYINLQYIAVGPQSYVEFAHSLVLF